MNIGCALMLVLHFLVVTSTCRTLEQKYDMAVYKLDPAEETKSQIIGAETSKEHLNKRITHGNSATSTIPRLENKLMMAPADDGAPPTKHLRRKIHKRNLDLDLDMDFRLRSPVESIKPMKAPLPEFVSIDTSLLSDGTKPEDGQAVKNIKIGAKIRNLGIEVETEQKKEEEPEELVPTGVDPGDEIGVRAMADEAQDERESEEDENFLQIKLEQKLNDDFQKQMEEERQLGKSLNRLLRRVKHGGDYANSALVEIEGAAKNEDEMSKEIEAIEDAETDYEDRQNNDDYDYENPKIEIDSLD